MPSSPRKPWTRDELIVAMNLYTRLDFGQFHARQPLIVTVAEKLRRTPGSVAMKLCNFASFDLGHQARGVSGLKGASRLDRQIWDEFQADWDAMGTLSELSLARLMGPDEQVAERSQPFQELELLSERLGPTNRLALANQRIGQDFFRRAVVASYRSRCCITGNPLPELLTASHILPWKEAGKERLNPANGLCLAKTQDAAFDQGLITLDEDLRVVLSRRIRDHTTLDTLRQNFQQYEGKPISLPHRFAPDPAFLEHHREKVFVA